MAKFSIGTFVHYSGPEEVLRTHFSRPMRVLDIIPNNCFTRKGERNVSGENICNVEASSGLTFLFKESELSVCPVE